MGLAPSTEQRALLTAVVPVLQSLSAGSGTKHLSESAPSDAARGSGCGHWLCCGSRANLTGDAALRQDREPPGRLVESAQPPKFWSLEGRRAGADAKAYAAPSLIERLPSPACRCRDLRTAGFV
jgi:hypothetical protein